MQIRIYVAERLVSETSQIARLDKKQIPVEWTTLETLYEDGWRLVSITPIPEEEPFRVYVAVEKA